MKDDDEPSYSEELNDLESWDHNFWLSRAFALPPGFVVR